MDLAKIEEMLRGVTPGPWRNETRYSFIAHDNTWHVLWDVPNSTGVSLVSDTGGNTASCKNDARFIAAARRAPPLPPLTTGKKVTRHLFRKGA
jgi:hypothetical protein